VWYSELSWITVYDEKKSIFKHGGVFLKMRVRQTVKRLFAVATGAAMLGATAMGALAADLGDYPTMFVEDGTYNGFFVVGENAASVDNLAMTDIATSMMVPGSSGGVSVSVDGDAWAVGTSSDWLEINESIGPSGTNTGIVDYISDTELGALADGTFTNSKGSFDYEQKLHFDSSNAGGKAWFQENDDDVVGLYWKIADGDQIAKYELDFTTDAESDIDASDSNSLNDFEDKSISFLGKQWTMTTATYTAAADGVKLTFMGGATLATLQEGDSGSYAVSGTDYDVAVTYVDADEVAFVVNGEATGKLEDGETFTLADSTDIGVSDILYQDYAGGIHSADFFLGANKVEFVDTTINDTTATSTNELKVNEETIDGADVFIVGTVPTQPVSTTTDGELKIDYIWVNMTAQDDIWMDSGDKLSADSELEEPQLLFTENWDIEYFGTSDSVSDSPSRLKKSGDDKYVLEFLSADGNTVELPLIFGTSASTGQLGDKSGDNLVMRADTNITDDDYFVLANKETATAGNSDAVTTVFQYRSAKNSGDTTQTVTFKNINTGENFDRTFADDCTFDISVEGRTHTFDGAIGTECVADDWDIKLTSTDYAYTAMDGNNVSVLNVRDASGTLFAISNELRTAAFTDPATAFLGASSGILLTASYDDTDRLDDYTSTAETLVGLNLTVDSSTEVTFATPTSPAWSVSDPDDSDLTWYYSATGVLMTKTAPSGSPPEFDWSSPDKAREVSAYVTSGSTQTVSSASGDLMPVTVVDATKLDSEIASVDAQNLIVVGGPCVNSVSAELLGSPSDCTEGFTPGRARVKLFEHANGNMAMLVAGFSGQDTRLAGRVLAHRSGELTGMEVEIEGTTFSDATIGAPAPVVMVEETVEEVVVDDSTGTE
jgi:hypothetical protein